MKAAPPILYSFRRCPYAMRARLAIQSSGIKVQLREIVLQDKAPEFLNGSPKGTVPVLVSDSKYIEESLDIMHWILTKADPEGWLRMPDMGYDWISRNDGPFKAALDHTKYAVRFPDINIGLERQKIKRFLQDLNLQISNSPWMFGNSCSLADMAILPFVRQLANVDRDWFDSQNWKNLHRWLTAFLDSDRFKSMMVKYKRWVFGDPALLFPIEPKLFST